MTLGRNMKSNAASLVVLAFFILCPVVLATEPPRRQAASQDAAPTMPSRININLDLAAMSALAITPKVVDNALAAFYQSHETFTLEELEALEITGERGAKVSLSKIATLKVTFIRASTTQPAAAN